MNKISGDRSDEEVLHLRVFLVFLGVGNGSTTTAKIMDAECCHHFRTGGSITEAVEALPTLMCYRLNYSDSESDRIYALSVAAKSFAGNSNPRACQTW